MKIIIEQDEAQTLRDIARSHEVDEEKLWDLYQAIMKSNYFEDLCDIARENEEELKGVYEWKN